MASVAHALHEVSAARIRKQRETHSGVGAISGGRDGVQELRCQAADEGNLENMFLAAGQELASRQEPRARSVRFRVIVEGQRQKLEPVVQEEAYQIGRELLLNAFRHAQASQVEAEIRYQRRLFRLHVRDNGRGIGPEVLEAGWTGGNCGLAGVRDRAKRISGRLDFWSKTGAGTEVKLTVPALLAYTAACGAAGFGRFTHRLMPFTRR